MMSYMIAFCFSGGRLRRCDRMGSSTSHSGLGCATYSSVVARYVLNSFWYWNNEIEMGQTCYYKTTTSFFVCTWEMMLYTVLSIVLSSFFKLFTSAIMFWRFSWSWRKSDFFFPHSAVKSVASFFLLFDFARLLFFLVNANFELSSLALTTIGSRRFCSSWISWSLLWISAVLTTIVPISE